MAVVVKRVNRLGIPAIKSIGAELTTTRLTFKFANHMNVSDYFQGLFLVYITSVPADAATTENIPIYFSTEGYQGSEKQLFTPQTAPVFANEVKEGVYLCFYDSTTDRLRVMM